MPPRPIHLPIAEPCHEDWDAMEPRERGRFCASCKKDVHDLSSMTEDEARAFLRERAGTRLCVNYRHDTAGRIQFRAAAAAALAVTALAACTPHERATPQPTTQTTEPAPTAVVPPSMPTEPPKGPEPQMPTMLGQAVAPPVEPMPMRKGDISVPNEPCDPPVEPTTMIRGEIAPEPPPVVETTSMTRGRIRAR